MKYLYNITLSFIIFLSCSENKSQKNIHYVKPYSEYNADSISYKQWYATAFLIPEKEVPNVEKVNEVEILLINDTQNFRDSLCVSISEDKIPLIQNNNGEDMSIRIKNYLTEGNIKDYCENNFYWYPASLYMAEIYSFPPAYIDTYYSLILLNKKQSKSQEEKINEYSLEYINRNEQNLAIYCLIKAYKKGNISEAKTLAQYFREGKYLPKDNLTAIELDYIYENRPLIEFK